jgi:hypothetical protein
MDVGAIQYLWNHPIFARMQWKQKYLPKFSHIQWKLPRYAIIIGSTTKIGSACMQLRVCTWSSGWMRFLCYLYELFTLFEWSIYAICAKKQNHNLWHASHTGDEMLDRGFEWRVGERFDLVHTDVGCRWTRRCGSARSQGLFQGCVGVSDKKYVFRKAW